MHRVEGSGARRIGLGKLGDPADRQSPAMLAVSTGPCPLVDLCEGHALGFSLESSISRATRLPCGPRTWS